MSTGMISRLYLGEDYLQLGWVEWQKHIANIFSGRIIILSQLFFHIGSQD